MLAWRSFVKAAILALSSQFASIATDLFPTPCLNPHRSKEFRSTLVPITLQSGAHSAPPLVAAPLTLEKTQ
jgi:hypothetical protein